MTRSEAIQRLAAVLHFAMTRGYVPTEPPDGDDWRDDVWSEDDRALHLRIAASLLTTLGAVFVEPAMVEAVREARAASEAECFCFGPNTTCNACCKRELVETDLADAILDQIRPAEPAALVPIPARGNSTG